MLTTDNIMKINTCLYRNLKLGCGLTLLALGTLWTLKAQTTASPPGASDLPVDPGVLQPLLDGLAGKYGWLTTVLLVMGSLRILFKPIMLVVENALKNDTVKFAAIQKFEAGPAYKAIAMVLDVGASIKLPLVKPPGGGEGRGA